MYRSYLHNFNISCKEINFYKSHIEWLRNEELLLIVHLSSNSSFKLQSDIWGSRSKGAGILSGGSASFAHRRALLMRIMRPMA